MPTDTIIPGYQPPETENKPVDVDATEPDLNTDFEENASHLFNEIYERPGKEDLHESTELQCRLIARI